MSSSIQRGCVVAVLMLSLGLHWTVLQSAAWVGMMVSYSRGGGIGEALEKTFDGEHPCLLCKLVEAGAASDEDEGGNQTASPNVKKIDLALPWVDKIIFAQPGADDFGSLDVRAIARAGEPSVPPPRVA
jgi:hypothetical protein